MGSASTATINGVAFAAGGNNASTNSGTNWAITQGFGSHGSDAWVGGNGSYQSTVQGNIGTMLDKGFRFGGDSADGLKSKIKLTGLTDGQAYVFALYSHAWANGIRNFDVFCSDMAGSTRMNQDQYHTATYDGLLLECTYIADGTEVEFTIDPTASSTFHLYAFSNRVATSASNTSLGTKAVGAFSSNLTSLTAGTRYEYAFVATNNGGSTQSGTSNFVTLGLPQVLTPGATDVTKTSVTLNADLNSTGGVTYVTGQPFSGTSVPGMLMWMDGNDPDADGTANTSAYNLANGTGWQDKSGKYRHADQIIGTPSFVPNTLNSKGVVYFDGSEQAYLSSANSLAAHTDKFSIFLLSRDKGTTRSIGHVSTYNTWTWTMGAKTGHIQNVAYFSGWLYPGTEHTDSKDTTDFHLYQVTLDDQDNGNVWLDQNKVLSNGNGADNGTNRKPGQIGFGGYNGGDHTRSKCEVAEFIVLNRVVSEDERQKIEGYLARKWGLMGTMFSAAHPYYSTDPYQPTVTQGGENAAVTFYWGDNNGSQTPGNWDNSQAISGTHGVGVVSHALSGLTAGTTYYYTAKAVTSAGTSWGP